MNSDLQVLSR